jgi:hypothetical protein
MAKTEAERRRLFILLAFLGAVAIWGGLKLLDSGGLAGVLSREQEIAFSPHTVPVMEMARLTPVAVDQEVSKRNPFTYGVPPTPTPNLTPPPTQPPRPTPVPRPPTPTPTPWPGGMGPPPNFDRTYIGHLGPDRLLVAVFRKGDELEVAVAGDVLSEKFILLSVGLESVEIGFVGYPEEVVTRVPIAEN